MTEMWGRQLSCPEGYVEAANEEPRLPILRRRPVRTVHTVLMAVLCNAIGARARWALSPHSDQASDSGASCAVNNYLRSAHVQCGALTPATPEGDGCQRKTQQARVTEGACRVCCRM